MFKLASGIYSIPRNGGQMKVALIGATGMIGSRLLAELNRRGHQVTAIVRRPEKVPALPNVAAKKGDVFDEKGLAELLRGHDAVISAVHFLDSDPKKLLAGGAGSLEVAPGVKLIDTPQFPAQYKAEAQAGADFLGLLREEKALDWTFLSPSAVIAPGERTGKFRLGGDQLLTHDKGSNISAEDYAIAMVDELEKPAHSRRRFTVGY